jgi:SCF-associated factor 1
MGNLVERELERREDKAVRTVLGGTNPIIPCETWEANLDPIQLPPLPTLPDLDGEAVGNQRSTQLIKIAGMDNHLIGLTNKGHLLKFGSLHGSPMVSRGSWEYVSDEFV